MDDFEFQHESRLVEETGSLAPCHEQIDVAVRAGVAAGAGLPGAWSRGAIRRLIPALIASASGV